MNSLTPSPPPDHGEPLPDSFGPHCSKQLLYHLFRVMHFEHFMVFVDFLLKVALIQVSKVMFMLLSTEEDAHTEEELQSA